MYIYRSMHLLIFNPALQVYYYNTFTNKSSWEKPEGFLGDNGCVTETPKPVASARIKGCDWTEVKCADGRKYFFHILTQVFAWISLFVSKASFLIIVVGVTAGADWLQNPVSNNSILFEY